jgi:PAS domain S-box-containing protein
MDGANLKNAGIIFLISFTILLLLTTRRYSQTIPEDNHSNHFENSAPLKNHLKFEHFKIEDGLPQNTIYCIHQDRRGFLWLATEAGLSRYDGYGFKNLEYDAEQKGSLSNNTIRTLYEEDDGTLWVGTEEGLNRFDRYTDSFKRYAPINNVTAIVKSLDGNLWIAVQERGIFKFDKLYGKFIFCNCTLLPSTSSSKAPHKSSQNNKCNVKTFFRDSNGSLWVGMQNGLNRFDEKNETLKHYKFPGQAVTTGNKEKKQKLTESVITNNFYQVNAICEDGRKRLWIGTKRAGLYYLDMESDRLKKVEITHKAPNSSNRETLPLTPIIYALIADKKSNNLWIGTMGDGLIQLNPHTGDSISYVEHSGINTSLSNNKIYSLFEDKGGLIWVGTEGGLNKLDKKKNEFHHWTAVPCEPNSLDHNYVWSIYEDKARYLWIGTNTGLNRFHKETESFEHYQHDPGNPNSLPNAQVMAIYEDSRDQVWVGTGQGFYRFERGTRSFERFQLEENEVQTILEDHLNFLWVGTTDGLFRIDPQRKNYTGYKHNILDKHNLSSSRITCIYEDRTGTLWIATDGGGLNRYIRETDTFFHYKHNPEQAESLCSDSVSFLCEDKNNNLWVGTYNKGLDCLDRETGKCKHFQKKDGLPSDAIYGILEDGIGHLWISTVKGLSHFEPRTGTFKNYDVNDGLQSDEFNGGAFCKSSNGEMYFGGTNGFNHFHPFRIKKNSNTPPVVFTDFRIFNKRPPFIHSITESKSITLEYSWDVFSIEFAALDFSSPEKNKYEYQMEKVDPNWVKASADKRFVTYTKLRPGTYTFRVKGFNNDGKGNPRASTLKIIVKPPFWLTWWFLSLMAVMVIIAIFGIFRLRTRLLRDKLVEQQRVQKILTKSRDEMENARDLAELRSAENEILLKAISVIFIAVDTDGIIFQWNRPSEQFFDIPKKQAEKKPLTEVLTNYINPDAMAEIMTEILQKGENLDSTPREMDIRVDLRTIGKGLKSLFSVINPIMDRSKKKLGFLIMAEDITNRREEEMLRNLSKKLESLGQMASGIAHEIKTPLQYIGHNAQFVSDSFNEVVGFFQEVTQNQTAHEKSPNQNVEKDIEKNIEQNLEQNLEKKQDSPQEFEINEPVTPDKISDLIEKYDMEYIIEEIPTACDQIIDGVERVSNIIIAMNEFSHPGRGFKEKSDINRLLNSTLVMAQNRIKKSADIQLDLFEDLPHINCYPAELNQVFLNILLNAVDAISETGKWGLIRITTAREGDEVLISISDNGCGMAKEVTEHMFDPFFTTKEVGKGTGQGLSLAHNVIIEKHKGKLDFTSKEKEGTTFFIRLPIEGEP